MFYSTMWASCGGLGGAGVRPTGHGVMWSAYLNGLLSVDLENMPEDADVDHIGMRSPITPPPSSCTDLSLATTGAKANPPVTPVSSCPSTPAVDITGGRDGRDDLRLTNGTAADHRETSVTDPPMANGLPRRSLSSSCCEDEKIQEYLQRSDTAVIFPEPVERSGGGNDGIKASQSAADAAKSDIPNLPAEGTKVLSEYLLKCPHCDQVYSGSQAIPEFKDHLSTAHKELPPPPRAAESAHICPKCNASFSCKENLAKHKLFHVSNGQISEDVKRRLKPPEEGGRSPRNIEEEKKEGSVLSTDESATLRKFKCPECGKAFKFKHHLKEHIRIHSGEKPFACANCGKRFSHSGSYSSHMTSKKCLVVNLKVRKVDTRTPRGRGSTQNNSFRPIIPKYGSTGGSAVGGNDHPLIPAGYMPSSERFPAFLPPGRPQQPFLPLPFHPLLAAPHQHYPLPLGAFPEVTQILQHRLMEKECPAASDHPSPLPLPPLPPSSSSSVEKQDECAEAGQPLNTEMNAVKKILEIVDATVTKQQQNQPHQPQPQQASTKARNGLLSELLSVAPQFSCCRFCSRLFDSKIELHQHERYLCHLNMDLRGPKLFASDGRQENSDGESSKESGEENRPRSSSIILNGDNLQTLKAHYQVNPRPLKSEINRIAHDLGCSARTVQAWFRSQQHHSRDAQMNGERAQSPALQHHSPSSPFTTIIPHYNGALPTTTNSTPLSQQHTMHEHVPVLNTSRDINHVSFVHHPLDNDQPLDLSVKSKREESNSCRSSPIAMETEVLNLSQRSSRTATPPKESNNHLQQYHQHQPVSQDSDAGDCCPPLHRQQESHLQASLLYKYMQQGLSGAPLSPPSESSPLNPPIAAVTPTSPQPERSPPHAEAPQGLPSPDAASRAENSSSPSGTMGSYGHVDEPADGDPSSPNAKKFRLWNQGEGDESTLDDSPGPEEDSSGGSGKMRKSWKLHKVESEEGMYACDQCDKMFSKQSSLARHKYEHSGQRPHKCDVCSKAFKHKHHLTEHKRLHSGEKPFQCKKCLKRFSHSGSYSQHMNHRYSYCKPYHE